VSEGELGDRSDKTAWVCFVCCRPGDAADNNKLWAGGDNTNGACGLTTYMTYYKPTESPLGASVAVLATSNKGDSTAVITSP